MSILDILRAADRAEIRGSSNGRVKYHDGARIAYELSGSGPPLVLIHGGWADHTSWSLVVPMLTNTSGDRDQAAVAFGHELVGVPLAEIEQQRASPTWAGRVAGVHAIAPGMRGSAWTLVRLGALAIQRGDYSQADAHLAESLDLSRQMGDRQGSARCLDAFAQLARAQG